jgi:hypothetical protein
MFINAATLFRVSTTAYERIKNSSNKNTDLLDTLTAVIFSVTALEAFINEAKDLVKQHPSYSHPPEAPSITTFATLLDKFEEGREKTILKFYITKIVFTGTPYDSGQQPYQDFSLLVKLRNQIVHFKSDKFDKDSNEIPKIIKQLPKKIIRDFSSSTTTTWINRLDPLPTAYWSCNVAVDMVKSILDIVPKGGHFKETLDFSYGKFFNKVK